MIDRRKEVNEWQGDKNLKASIDYLMYTVKNYLLYFVKIYFFMNDLKENTDTHDLR